MALKIQKNSRLLMIGDSITDSGRVRPVGEGLGGELGNGYVALIAAALNATCPERNIHVINTGSSGDQVRHLKQRWKTDVIDLKPDWLSIMIGINDVWRQFDRPLQPEAHVRLPEYERTLDELVRATAPGLKGLVLMAPYVIEPNRREPMRAMMDRYGAAARKIALRHGAVFADTQAAFDAVLRHRHPMALAWDRIHPNLSGHMLMARTFLDAIGYKS
jgi:lysophospholipase L1-like esterase